MLASDPVPWLMAQEGLPAIRARRLLRLDHEGDAEAVVAIEGALAQEQDQDGSFSSSPIRTAGVLNLLDDLHGVGAGDLIANGGAFLLSVLEGQPGSARAEGVAPGSLTVPCDLGGFFGPYEARADPAVVEMGAREMDHYREYEPLLGSRSPLRSVRRSSYDRVGPTSCYSWGLIPLCYTIEALCRAGLSADPRLLPATDALLGAQRESGGWCRNVGGHPTCSIHAVRALGAHAALRETVYAERALGFMRAAQDAWRGNYLFAAIQAIARYNLPIAHEILHDALGQIADRQRKNGTFGTPCRVERTAAVLVASRALAEQRDSDPDI